MEKIRILTQSKKQIVDITETLNTFLSKHSYTDGVLSIQVLHTTAAVTTADLDPGTDLDMLDAFEAIVPKLAYRHPHDPAHVGDHIMASLIGPSMTLIVNDGALVLGAWQRVVLVELDGPRDRDVALCFLSASADRSNG